MADGTLILNLPKPTAGGVGGGARTGTDDLTILAAVLLTTSYVYSEAVRVLGFAKLLLTVNYVKGSEVTVQIIMQRAKTTDGTYSGTTWKTVGVIQAPSAGGLSEGTKNTINLTPANWAADDAAEFDIDVQGKQLVRFGVKYTGGSAPGTIGLDVAGGVTAVAG